MSAWSWWYKLAAKITFMDTRPENVYPIISITYGCGTREKPDFSNLIVAFGRERTQSLYYNGIFFFRFMLVKHWFPFYLGWSIRWSGSTTKKAFLQTHIGPRLSGQFAITLRIQSDESAVISNTGDPTRNNYGHGFGWECGTK